MEVYLIRLNLKYHKRNKVENIQNKKPASTSVDQPDFRRELGATNYFGGLGLGEASAITNRDPEGLNTGIGIGLGAPNSST